MKKVYSIAISLVITASAICANKPQAKDTDKSTVVNITKEVQKKTIASLLEKYPKACPVHIQKGVTQTASLWRASDGCCDTFSKFCLDNFEANKDKRAKLFDKLERNYEIINGYMLKMELLLKEPIDMDLGPVDPIDMMFGTYSPGAHTTQDFYNNKIAFITSLNFPNYSLAEKSANAKKWSRREWAYARMGDMFTSRVPSSLVQYAAKVGTLGDAYINEYNIFMGHLLDKNGNRLFPEDLRLITHWGLRDELKSNYNNAKNGFEKQEMIYSVMKRIIDQSIPKAVINSNAYDWNPMENKLYKDGEQIAIVREDDKRYQVLLDNFKVKEAFDKYNPNMPTYIQRRFEGGMEIAQQEVEALFTDLVSSPVVKDVAKLIKKRLGRKLRPYDIWYNGFAGRNSVSEEELDKIIGKKYPTAKALEEDLPNIMIKLGFKEEDAKRICKLIRVDDSRGIGHAWGTTMRNEKARLRTRVEEDGMKYKGYNIAIHEFGHNVEQTITMNDVDFYMMNGVPNTAFTETLAFIFQKRDLEILGMADKNEEKEHLMALNNFWSCYEIMGVSLVDMGVWKWLYANPNATKVKLKEAVIKIAKEIWNKYYAPVFGTKDEPILAIYSHMIDNPLYLSAYPMGRVVEFQVEKQLKGKDFANEIFRIYTQGVYVPQYWMNNAVGADISTMPLIEATKEAVKIVEK